MGADSDSDEEDLWAGLDDAESTIACSANLLEMLGRDPKEAIVHKGDADENKITWVPPSFSGLSNSTVVTCKTQHWNKDGDAAVALSAAPAGSTVTPTGGTAMAADGATKENAPVGGSVANGATGTAVVPGMAPAGLVGPGKAASAVGTQPAAAAPAQPAVAAPTSTFTFSADGRIVW